MASVNEGLFVVGRLKAIEEGKFPRLLISSGGDYDYRVSFRFFDQNTGEQLVPDDVAVGDRVTLRVTAWGKTYADKTSGEVRAFVDLRLEEFIGAEPELPLVNAA